MQLKHLINIQPNDLRIDPDSLYLVDQDGEGKESIKDGYRILNIKEAAPDAGPFNAILLGEIYDLAVPDYPSLKDGWQPFTSSMYTEDLPEVPGELLVETEGGARHVRTAINLKQGAERYFGNFARHTSILAYRVEHHIPVPDL